jgi:Rrf2 family transcriptional regulator, cysteine metabolism repressor
LKINTKARYSIRLLCDIVKNGVEAPVSLKDVSERQNISRRYLEQIAIPLRNASLLRSIPGLHGGYRFAKPPSEIRLLDIIEAVDGPVRILDCLNEEADCERMDICETRGVWMEINDSITKILSSYTMEDLALAAARAEKKAGAAACSGKKPARAKKNQPTGRKKARAV